MSVATDLGVQQVLPPTTQDTVWLMLPCAPAGAKSQGSKASLKALQYQTNSAPTRDFPPLFLGTCLWMMISSLFIPMRTDMLANHASVPPGSSLEMVLARSSKMDDGVKQGNSENYTLCLPSSKLWLYPGGTWKIPGGPVVPRVLTLISEHSSPLWSVLLEDNIQ